MFCLPQDLNQPVLGELRLSWSSVLWGDTDQYMNVGNKGRAGSWLSLPSGSWRSGRGFLQWGKGRVCSVEPQHKAVLAGACSRECCC